MPPFVLHCFVIDQTIERAPLSRGTGNASPWAAADAAGGIGVCLVVEAIIVDAISNNHILDNFGDIVFDRVHGTNVVDLLQNRNSDWEALNSEIINIGEVSSSLTRT